MSEFVIYRKGTGGPTGRVKEPTVVIRKSGLLAVNVAAMEALMLHRNVEGSLEMEIWALLLWDEEAKRAAICPREKGFNTWKLTRHLRSPRQNFYETSAKSFARHIGVAGLRRFPAQIIDHDGGSIMFDVGSPDA